MFKKIILPMIGGLVLGAILQSKCKKLPIIGEMAPDFIAESTEGTIKFPEKYKGKWTVFFSHPADFTPVCTTELVAIQSAQKEFAEMNVSLIGLSVDNLESHKKWIKSIEESVNIDGCTDNIIKFPMIDDSKKQISKLYGMLPKKTDDTRTVRAVFIIDPNSIIRAVLYYPPCVGRNIEEIKRIVTALKTVDEFGVVTPANWEIGNNVLLTSNSTNQISNYDERNGEINCSNWYLCFKNISKDAIIEKIYSKK